MRPLQNRYVVGALVAIAIFLIARNTIRPLWERMKSSVVRSLPEAVQTSIATPATTPPAVVKIVPDLNIETGQLALVTAPKRDPFQSGTAEPAAPAPSNAIPLSSLSLSAIWRQTGQELAVINNKVVSVGDQVMGFRVEKIEADAVWLQGPAGPAKLEFRPAVSAPRTKVAPKIVPITNAVPATNVAPTDPDIAATLSNAVPNVGAAINTVATNFVSTNVLEKLKSLFK
jgi:hypothetical protein